VRVRRTFDLDNVKQMFGCSLHILMEWESDEDIPSSMLGPAAAGYEWEPKWRPRFIIKNLMETISQSTLFTIRRGPDQRENKCIVCAEMKYLVRIFHDMDLREFPFDIQRFAIAIEMEGIDSEHVHFVPPSNGLLLGDCDFNRCLFEDMQLATDKTRALEAKIYETERQRSRRKLAYSGVVLHLTFGRRTLYFISNVAFIMFLICSFVLTAWASDDVGDRQAVDFTLLLTAVAFKLVVVSMLPPVAYFTYLDYYVLCCLLYLAANCVMHSVLPWLSSTLGSEEATALDTLSFQISFGVWLVFNVFCAVAAKRLAASTASPFLSGRIRDLLERRERSWLKEEAA